MLPTPPDPFPPVLSHFQVKPLLAARRTGEPRARFSLDLGRSSVEVDLEPQGVRLPDGELLAWELLERVAGEENACFLVQEGELEKIQRFSPAFNRVYTLYPTPGPPTLLISGIPMHRIKGTDPGKDTRAKIRAAGPFTGPVLDTSTGLGYTAIEAARQTDEVITIELDPVVLEVAALNPWSLELFRNPRIHQRIGDSADVVPELPAEHFTQAIHDPPMFSLAGHLYSTAFYRELWRVLRHRGKLYHYIGNPASKSGKNVTRGVMRRLEEAGFVRVRPVPRAFGVIAFKP